MRYGSLVASAAVVLGLAACKGSETGMNDDLAKDLAAATSSDALALAPRAGVQTLVSVEELSPHGRTRLAPSTESSRATRHHASHRDRVEAPSTMVAAAATPAPVAAPAPVPAESASSTASTSVDGTQGPSSPRPQPVDVSYPANDPGPMRGDRGGAGGIGGILGTIGGAILRGGAIDGDHCDPRAHRNGGGGILINQRGPILRGTF